MFKRNAIVSAVAAPLALGVSMAQAAVPAGAEALFTTLATDTGTILGYSFTAMVVIVGGWIVFDMVKRGAKKAAK